MGGGPDVRDLQAVGTSERQLGDASGIDLFDTYDNNEGWLVLNVRRVGWRAGSSARGIIREELVRLASTRARLQSTGAVQGPFEAIFNLQPECEH